MCRGCTPNSTDSHRAAKRQPNQSAWRFLCVLRVFAVKVLSRINRQDAKSAKNSVDINIIRFIWLGAGLLRLNRYRRKARALDPLPAAVAEMQSHTGARAPVYVSSEIDVPATFGVCHPVILFPARIVKMEASLQQAIACHEFLHVRRFDWVFALVEEIIGALLWFHPAI